MEVDVLNHFTSQDNVHTSFYFISFFFCLVWPKTKISEIITSNKLGWDKEVDLLDHSVS
jgi:hypothetical protein